MKELSIEEKAQAYDKAVKIAKSKIENDKDHVLYEDDITEIFPELQENEDERIRKSLFEYFKNRKDDGDIDETWYGISYDEILAWLEQQGDIIENNMLLPFKEYDNLMDSINKKKKEGYEAGYKQGLIDSKNDQHVQPKFKVGDTIRVKSSSAEYVITDIYGGCYHGKGWGLDIISADRSGDYELVEQKPAWTEEDESIINDIEESLIAYKIIVMDNDMELANHIEKEINYFKSLKDRVQPQLKQEWSEDDENMLNSIIATCELAEQDRDSSPARHLFEMQTDWLKSLKERYSSL